MGYAIRICNQDMQSGYAIRICNQDMQYQYPIGKPSQTCQSHTFGEWGPSTPYAAVMVTPCPSYADARFNWTRLITCSPISQTRFARSRHDTAKLRRASASLLNDRDMVLRWCAISPIARASYIPLAYCRIYDKAVPCLFRINFCGSVLASFGNPAYECLNLVVLSARNSDLAHSQLEYSIRRVTRYNSALQTR